MSGKDLLGDFQRPIGQTVAFGLELPQLGQGHENVFQLTVVNLHEETKLEHLSTAVRATLGVTWRFEGGVDLKFMFFWPSFA